MEFENEKFHKKLISDVDSSDLKHEIKPVNQSKSKNIIGTLPKELERSKGK